MDEKRMLFEKIREENPIEYKLETNKLVEQFLIDLTPKQEKEFLKLMDIIEKEQTEIEFSWYLRGINTVKEVIF